MTYKDSRSWPDTIPAPSDYMDHTTRITGMVKEPPDIPLVSRINVDPLSG
jgi:hypothetical protein